jgi:hypothetical protein
MDELGRWMRSVDDRLRQLETNGPGLPSIVVKDSSLSDYTCAASPSAMETDTTLTITITPLVTSTLYIWCCGTINSDTARQVAIKFQFILDDTTTTSNTEGFSEPVVSMNVTYALMGHYSGVTAAAHTVKLQVQRMNVADVVKVLNRYILVMAVPE